ncbi:lipase family protein [Bradyrhizobium sp. Arg237L]|uniref:lipase family protein n=1 Tax=Bradyrhizobium sp. Arg237L TaxID=3003352 RepID=UPI00249DED88|nr:lipase family protein [Bradyrhizobium sp. Arg237L]MDI4232341.1 lipase family protein [Bradyrhizobium sp. Arg237L]
MTIAPGRRAIWLAVLSFLLARVVGTPLEGSAQEMFAGVTVRAPDAFYDPPAQVPDTPGVLLRSEPLQDVTLPAGMRGWRILYTTTVNDATRATAVATVFAPIDPPAGPRPVIAWEHGTTGLQQKCMPSLISAPTLGIPALDRIVRAAWVIVATDYSFAERGGPHPYLIGEGEGRAALDSVRAARQMPELTLDARTVVWGHSQGGHSALWTGIIAPRYAPEIEIAGVAAIAPAADLRNILAMNQGVDKRLGPYVALSYSRFYPDIAFEQAVRPEAFAAAREIAGLCGFLPAEEPMRAAALTATFEGPTLATRSNPALSARLAQNSADHPIAAPVVIAQGAEDDVVPPAATAGYVEERCAAGQRFEYWTFVRLDHGMVQPGSKLEAPLMAWTAARFQGEPPPKGCTRKSF